MWSNYVTPPTLIYVWLPNCGKKPKVQREEPTLDFGKTYKQNFFFFLTKKNTQSEKRDPRIRLLFDSTMQKYIIEIAGMNTVKRRGL